jgi:alkylglycerol monooxygenase
MSSGRSAACALRPSPHAGAILGPLRSSFYIAAAVPFFFLLIGVELWVARRRGARVYRFADAINDLSCGVTQQVMAALAAGALIAGYVWLFQFRLFQWSPARPWAWLVAFLSVDFTYYWWHRLSHRVNVLWAGHVVHHQSEDYNLAVALRQAVFTSWTSFALIAAPLALLGIPPVVQAAAASFNTLYQFWIHTQLIGRLGPLDRVINTPSNHRVHHAINPRYIDKNYGGTLMIWDRLFGTFEPETEPCVYGIVKPLRSYNPLWAQVHYWAEMAKLARSAATWGDRLRVLVKGPEWRPNGAPPAVVPAVSPQTFPKYDPRAAPALQWYVGVQFVSVVAATMFILLFQDSVPAVALVALAGLVLWALVAWGALMESRPWGIALELARLAVSAAAIVAFVRSQTAGSAVAVAIAAVAVAAASACWLRFAPRAPVPA